MTEKKFAVLVPIIEHEDGPRILLMKRPERKTDSYSGQVCLPGGALESDDGSLLECALREAGEELGILADTVEIIAELDWQETGFRHAVKPFVGWLETPPEIRPNPAEVEHVLYLPTARVEAGLFKKRGEWIDPRGGKREILTFDLDGCEVWGLTARILEHGFISGSEAPGIQKRIKKFPGGER